MRPDVATSFVDKCVPLFVESFTIPANLEWKEKKNKLDIGFSKFGLAYFIGISSNKKEASMKVLSKTVEHVRDFLQGGVTFEQLLALSLLDYLMETVSLEEEGRSFLLPNISHSLAVYSEWKNSLLDKYGGRIIRKQLIDLLSDLPL